MPVENGRMDSRSFREMEIEYDAVVEGAQLTVDVSLASPLYGGGVEAGQLDTTTPFRTSGIRGSLRYWWRATRGASFETWEKMRDAEASIWGDTDKESRVRVDVRIPEKWTAGRVKLRKFKSDLNRGYALFPPYNQKGVDLEDPAKQFLEAGNFRLTLTFRDSSLRNEVESALWGWVNFGGLGARTRRGAGSLFCHPYAGWDDTFISGDGALRSWPTLKGGTIVWGPRKTGPTAWGDAWVEALQLYREFRQDREGRGPTSWPEPDEIRAIRQRRAAPSKEGFPRGALGLPIVFHFKDRGRNPADQSLSIDKHFGRSNQPEEGRMTSPVILKSLAVAKDLAYPVVLAMNAPGPGQLYLFQKGAKTEPVPRGRRNGVEELILRAQQRWNTSAGQI